MRGYLKRRRQRRVVAQHLNENGGFVFHGRTVRVPEDIGLGIQSIIADGSYEAAECELIGQFLPANIPVIELGGCLGLVSSVVAGRLHPEILHVVVEANPRLHDACLQNASSGRIRDKTVLVPKAISYSNSMASFDINKNAHVSKLSEDHAATATMIAAIKLRDLVEMLEPPSRYVLICDIEGAEVEILEHDSDALKSCDLLIIELHPNAYHASGHTVQSLVEIIQRAGLAQVARVEDVYAFKR